MATGQLGSGIALLNDGLADESVPSLDHICQSPFAQQSVKGQFPFMSDPYVGYYGQLIGDARLALLSRRGPHHW
jgi:hypothetical protein